MYVGGTGDRDGTGKLEEGFDWGGAVPPDDRRLKAREIIRKKGVKRM